jgi:hypothetical protein
MKTATSVYGTFETCRPAMTMSAPGKTGSRGQIGKMTRMTRFGRRGILPIRVRACDFVLSDAIAC